ncbi:hypothetical protein [Halostella sp. PRR32]|uniref:hypothetical protein n=1 Tax=Halostella sp. PRR32 TaxID=3098147 RepID=UPI002B1D1033|nr:hypothetical protein [Halostella sp. PRR32]
MSQSEAFLSGECHRCDICSTNFDSLKELANHDCAVADGSGNRRGELSTWLVDGSETVSCPGCGRTRGATPGRYICSVCGATFSVQREGDGGRPETAGGHEERGWR